MKRGSVAVACLILLAAVFAGLTASCGGSPWKFQTVEGESSLLAVSAADARHVWAVGGGPVYFYDGVSWKEEAAGLDPEPIDVVAVDPACAWACGGEGAGVIHAFDGSSWKRQFETGDETMNTVTACDAAHAWAVGTSESGANVYSFDGAAWSLQYSAEILVHDMYALDPAHVWAVAQDRSGRSAVYFFDGRSWSRGFEPPEGEILFGVTASDASSAWAVGSAPRPGGGSVNQGGSIFHFDGSSWSLQYQTLEELHRVTAAGGVAWATGGIGRVGPIYFFDGRYWSKQFMCGEALFDVSAAGPGHAWAVGGLGGIYAYEPHGP